MTPDTLPVEPFTYRLGNVVSDSNAFNTYRFHIPRGLLVPRMSALELVGVLGPHLIAAMRVVQFSEAAQQDPTIWAEYEAMILLLHSNPTAAVDRILPWIKSVVAEADDDVVSLCLGDIGKPVPVGPSYSLPWRGP